MKGIRFYLEYESPRAKRENRNKGIVIAIFPDGMALAPNDNTPNTGKISKSEWLAPWYLKSQTKRIPEPIARIIHPKLFEVLDNLNAKK